MLARLKNLLGEAPDTHSISAKQNVLRLLCMCEAAKRSMSAFFLLAFVGRSWALEFLFVAVLIGFGLRDFYAVQAQKLSDWSVKRHLCLFESIDGNER